MNWTEIEGKWDQLKGKIKEKWGQLTDDDLMHTKQEHFSKRLRDRYNLTQEEADRQMDDFGRGI